MFEIKDRYPDVVYNDLKSAQQLSIITLKEITFKDISFFGGLVFGIILLVYMNRKIKAMARKHQIGLYRAIGMTKKQIVMGLHSVCFCNIFNQFSYLYSTFYFTFQYTLFEYA